MASIWGKWRICASQWDGLIHVNNKWQTDDWELPLMTGGMISSITQWTTAIRMNYPTAKYRLSVGDATMRLIKLARCNNTLPPLLPFHIRDKLSIFQDPPLPHQYRNDLIGRYVYKNEDQTKDVVTHQSRQCDPVQDFQRPMPTNHHHPRPSVWWYHHCLRTWGFYPYSWH